MWLDDLKKLPKKFRDKRHAEWYAKTFTSYKVVELEDKIGLYYRIGSLE